MDFNRLYSKEHTWVEAVEDRKVRIGLTEFAQHRPTEVVQVELPQPGEKVVAGQSIGTVESEKMVVDFYAPVNGQVVEVNGMLAYEPNTINTDSYSRGWMVVIQLTDREQLRKLLSAEQYLNLINS